MENATKALIMAASVLIGIILLSIMVYMFMSFGMSSVEIHKQNEQNQLNQFNSQFTSYEGKTGITIYDVITVANLATENNNYYGFTAKINNNTPSTGEYYITVSLQNDDGSTTIENMNDNFYKGKIGQDLAAISEENPNLREYNCKVTISPSTKRVWRVEFKQK